MNSAESFIELKQDWLKGPDWLVLPQNNWPSGNLGCIPTKFLSIMCIGNDNSESLIDNSDKSFMDFERFSSYTFLFNTVCCIFRAINLMKKSTHTDVKCKTFKFLMSQNQREFKLERAYLLSQVKDFNNPPKLAYKYNLFLDQIELLRSKTRISKNMKLSYDCINPIVLSNTHPITKLIILKAHEECSHLGVNATLCTLRRKGFWLERGRQVIGKTI